MMVHIDDSLFIGKGENRSCYLHPDDLKKCIKIPYADKHKEQRLECKYFKHLKSVCKSWDHISRYYGEIETNIGKGYVYELIRDFDDRISRSMSDYLCVMPEDHIDLEAILHSLKELKNFLLENKVIVRNLRAYNILFKKTSHQEGTAILIDNLGHHNALPHLSDHITHLAHIDLEKKWRKFETTVNIQVNS